MSHPMMMTFLLVYIAVISVSLQSVIKPPLLPFGLKFAGVATNDDSIPEASLNPAGDDIYQGDIRLTPEQYQQMNANEPKRLYKRQLNPQGNRWDKNYIPYYFHQSFPAGYAPYVNRALKYYEDHTCLRFDYIPNPSYFPESILEFGNDFTGCNSFVGRTAARGAQRINLNYGCFGERHNVLHEIGHALGFWHTQSRTDRDKHVLVDWNHIYISFWNQFQRLPENMDKNLGYPYDYMSIMHYKSSDFAVGGSALYTTNKAYQKLIGRGDELSFVDLAMLNRFYNCDENCKITLTCENGGYRNDKNCDECICASGYSGPTCAIRTGSEDNSTDCGATLKATSEWQTFEGKVDTTCTWWIESDEGTRIEFVMTDLNVEYSINCRLGGLELKLDHPWVDGKRVCYMSKDPHNIYSYSSSYNTTIINAWATERNPESFAFKYRQVV